MKVLHLIPTFDFGGLEVLLKNIVLNSEWKNDICCFYHGGIMSEELKKHNKSVIELKKKKWQRISLILDINRICKKENIDIVNTHAGGLYSDIVFCILKKMNPNIKFVKTLHGAYEDSTYLKKSKIKNKMIIYYMNKALQSADLIVSVSNFVQNSFERKFGIENKKKVIIYNGIDKKFFEQLPMEKKQDEKVRIIFVGRLIKAKGVSILLDSVKSLVKIGHDIELLIVGDGVERHSLQQQTKALQIENNVKFLGRQLNVIEWLDKSDIFVYPSVWEEAFGISVVEAMARGCLPVTFNKGGLPEIIKNGENGFIAKQVSPNELKDVIHEFLILDDKKIRQIKENAFETAKKFSIENTVATLKVKYNELYEEIKNDK